MRICPLQVEKKYYIENHKIQISIIKIKFTQNSKNPNHLLALLINILQKIIKLILLKIYKIVSHSLNLYQISFLIISHNLMILQDSNI
jgi:hypothetical protein